MSAWTDGAPQLFTINAVNTQPLGICFTTALVVVYAVPLINVLILV
jgi:hypothetical protein